MSKNIDDVFNIQGDIVPNTSQEIMVSLSDKEKELELDCDIVRGNLYGIVHTGKTALEGALNIALLTENPKAFEVVGSLMKQLADINHQILDVNVKKNKTNKEDNQQVTVNNNSLFVGTTKDLNNIINGLQNKP